MRHYKYSLVMYLFVILLMLFSVSCTPSNPVQAVALLRMVDGSVPSFVPISDSTAPSPTENTLLSAVDKIDLFIMLDKKFKGEITFSKITFFNKVTNEEVEIGSSRDLGPFAPGDYLEKIYDVPTQTGSYEVRIYVKNKAVARALFEIN